LARRSLADAAGLDPYSRGMPHAHHAPVRVRAADRADLDQLVALEHLAFPADRMSRRSFSGFLTNPHADLLVAERDSVVEGYALVLFRENSDLARLYSIAVAP